MARHWILKTREERNRDSNYYTEHWTKYKDKIENKGNTVIAIGWGLGPNEGNTTLQQLENYIKRKFYPESTTRAVNRSIIAARTVWKFINDMDIGDEVLLCQGYTATQKRGVKVSGIARITGPYWEHRDCNWFQRKRNADILYLIEKEVSKVHLAKLLGRESLLKTIHEIEKNEFKQTKQWLIQKR